MNDRFRFRAWDKQDKELIYEAENTYDCQIYNGHIIWHSNFAGLLDDEERYTVEQCTGLKDKNGRLIYEGDIVFHRVKSVEIGKVEWDKGGFWVVCNKWVIPWNFFTPSRWEVIGNIHENPKLLEVEK
jgi:uncharacterized phage protein (TIGR01671 family)